jgi:hypothetical protein
VSGYLFLACLRGQRKDKKTVTYGGYAVSVPASWPVYDLTKDPRQCVRYDRHAVYLGTPGPDQDCPPGVVGRVDTVSIGATRRTPAAQRTPAAHGSPAALPGTPVNQESKTGDRKGPAQTGQQAPKPGTVFQDPDQHELALTMPAAAPPATPKGPLAGFDTCAAPSLPTVKAWRARYAATSVYIGGQMMGCGQNSLSAGWVQQAKAAGWSLLPAFAGLQAPCDSFSGKVNARQAASQGTAAASQAVADARTYGIGQGSPIYYDMEGYDRTNSGRRPGRNALRVVRGVAVVRPVQAVPGQQDGQGRRDIAADRRRHGGQRGGARVTGQSPSRTG